MSELTTVGDDLAVVHDGFEVHRFEGLTPGTGYELGGHTFRTLDRPGGELLCRIATVNDVHFGETECGRIDNLPDGPILRAAPGEPPYPEVMNRAAAAEIRLIEPEAVIVKGDLTCSGTLEEFHAFDQCWLRTFGERLYVVRGNHDSYQGQQVYEGDQWIELPGVAVALMDTTIPHQTTGSLSTEQLAWLDDHAAASDRPVIVMGHHQQWVGGERNDTYFGLHPDASDGLAAVIARRRSIVAYTAGHTHRHRVRPTADGVPSVEIGCVKDFPGTWAEYRVFEGGILQVVHRISSPEALAWSEQCRFLYRDFGIDYQSYALGALGHRCFPIPLRS
jgi:3',5'-cyclic AMP phosphodiesterase CpdA